MDVEVGDERHKGTELSGRMEGLFILHYRNHLPQGFQIPANPGSPGSMLLPCRSDTRHHSRPGTAGFFFGYYMPSSCAPGLCGGFAFLILS
jgi:hypothetical protein